MVYTPPQNVLVTGARGNLGRKTISYLATQDWCKSVTAVCTPSGTPLPASGEESVQFIECDLRDRREIERKGILKGVDAIVHFAAQRPVVEATWDDAAISFDMTANLLDLAAAAGASRFVFASSNHVMGRYKDSPLAETIDPGGLTAELTPGPGTIVDVGEVHTDSTAYASSKLFVERACVSKAFQTNGALSTVSIRIGWCQPGENRPQTINISGGAGDEAPPPVGEDEVRALRWYRNSGSPIATFCI